MKKKFYFIFKNWVYFLIICITIACNSKAKLINTIYFNERKDSALALIINNYEPVVQPGDRLLITVSALDPASIAPYNRINVNNGIGGSEGYLVEVDGTIKFQQLGKLSVGGLRRSQIVDTVTRIISKFVNNPVVSVQFINFRVTVMGEVNRPTVLNIVEGRVNLLEVIGLTGDITPFGRRDNIMVIREKNGKREFGQINLLSMNSFNSPYFNMQQNDIVYVEPTKAKAISNDQALLRNLSVITSVLSVISTVFVLVLNITK